MGIEFRLRPWNPHFSNCVLGGIGAAFFTIDTEDFKSMGVVPRVDGFLRGDVINAWQAPRCPEIEQSIFGVQIRELMMTPIETGIAEIRQSRARYKPEPLIVVALQD